MVTLFNSFYLKAATKTYVLRYKYKPKINTSHSRGVSFEIRAPAFHIVNPKTNSFIPGARGNQGPSRIEFDTSNRSRMATKPKRVQKKRIPKINLHVTYSAISTVGSSMTSWEIYTFLGKYTILSFCSIHSTKR